MKPAIFLSTLIVTILACTTGPIITPTPTLNQLQGSLEPGEIEALKLYLVLTNPPLDDVVNSTSIIVDLAALKGEGLLSDRVHMIGGMIVELTKQIVDFRVVDPPDIAVEYHRATFSSLREIFSVLVRLSEFYEAAEDIPNLTEREIQNLGNTQTEIARQLRDALEHFSKTGDDRVKLFDLVER